MVNGVGMNYYCGYKNEKKYKKNIDEFKKNGFTIFQNYFKDSQVEELGKMIVQGYNKSLDSKINHKNISRLICKYESEKKYDELYNSFKLIEDRLIHLKKLVKI